MAETRLWDWLAGLLPPAGQYTRIETGETGPGTPDVHYQITPSCSGWIELKDARHPRAGIPFPDYDHGLRSTQIRWIAKNINRGGTVWIVARVGKDIIWIPGALAVEFNGSTRDELHEMASLIIRQDKVSPDITPREIALLLKFNGAAK